MLRNAQPEKVEECDRACDEETGPEDWGIIDELGPAAGEVEPCCRGTCRRDMDRFQDGEEDDDGQRAEESFEADCYERLDGVSREDLLFEYELCRGEDLSEKDEEYACLRV